MKLIKKEVRGVVLVEVRGKLFGGADNVETFHSFFKSLIAEESTHVVVSLRRVSWANSQGIGMLIGAYTSIREAGGELVLSHVIDRVRDILTVTRILLVFDTFESNEEAIDYLVGVKEGVSDA